MKYDIKNRYSIIFIVTIIAISLVGCAGPISCDSNSDCPGSGKPYCSGTVVVTFSCDGEECVSASYDCVKNLERPMCLDGTCVSKCTIDTDCPKEGHPYCVDNSVVDYFCSKGGCIAGYTDCAIACKDGWCVAS